MKPNDLFAIHHGDCITHMSEMQSESVDFSVFSPPFNSLYAYNSSLSDIGNSEDLSGDGKLHLSFFYRQLRRIVKPGRVIMVHVAQIPRMKRIEQRGGMHDFRGLNIRLAERAGLFYEYDWCVRKNPQAQAIRTRSRELQFSGLESDRAKSRGAMPDYLIKFVVPGDNQVPITDEVDVGGTFEIQPQVSRNEWIQWAECAWMDIRETDTLNVSEGRGENDTKHICPLQLGVIDRLVRLYSNPGELVFSPFAGIGSELYTALKLGRRAYGCELKDEYYHAAIKNCERAIQASNCREESLFDFEGSEVT